MSKSVLLVGPSVQIQEDLFAYLTELDFQAYKMAEPADMLVYENERPLVIFWNTKDSSEYIQLAAKLYVHVPVIAIVNEGEPVIANVDGVFAYLQKPLRWSEVLILLHPLMPEEGLIHSELQVGDWIDFSLASNRGIFQSMRSFLRALLIHSPLAKEQIYHILHSISEILLNAMEHGNHFDARKRVKGSYVLFQDRLVVKIEDQGCGFFPDDIPNPLLEPMVVSENRKRQGKRPGGYGLALASKWMSLTFSERGNTILLTKTFD